MKFLLLDFLFPLFFACNFYWIFGFLGFFYLVSIQIMNESPAQDYGLLPKTDLAHLDTKPNISEHDPKTERWECYRA